MNYHIANAIKEIRRINNLVQDELAELIGMSAGHIGMLEQGRAKPSYDTLDRLITRFNLDANMFFESRKNNKALISKEINGLLDGLSERQAYDLIQLFRVGVQIIQQNDTNENSNM